ncbi:dephospho-CoA kinase [Paraburkholderia tropica]|uniref:Dephospho-CoA kinase n=2 Tax=Paraburkholderia tropica TaxID=92647 RepID=A0AAQ1GND6_9BURK|nr:dephospho-CoA kinase [Paraburkholderia tropica]PZW72414.1 dephospho-CoA kinase [Paraburkholderia tropica]SEK14384.1 dephospho-CoA kinase [Paraburkholderia tropica]
MTITGAMTGTTSGATREPFTLGLTGGIGSGKSTVADLFAARGVPLVDTDVIAHRITAPGGLAMAPIAAQFGPEFVAADGSMDRARMRALVFSDETARKRLEAITHPLIRAETERETREANGPYVIVVVPLLVESGAWKSRVARVLVVDCSVETQIGRVMRRNGFSREQVQAIIARQATREARLAAADDVIVNDGAKLEALAQDVEILHQRYLALAGAQNAAR